MRRPYRRALRWCVVMVGSAVLLVALAVGQAGAAAAPKADPNGVLRVGYVQSFTTWDPGKGTTNTDVPYWSSVFDRLIYITFDAKKGAYYVPQLAKSYE